MNILCFKGLDKTKTSDKLTRLSQNLRHNRHNIQLTKQIKKTNGGSVGEVT